MDQRELTYNQQYTITKEEERLEGTGGFKKNLKNGRKSRN